MKAFSHYSLHRFVLRFCHNALAFSPSAPPPQDGKAVLYYAARHGWLDLIDKLLAKGADINVKDNVR
jgi:ankyrin repeat protein